MRLAANNDAWWRIDVPERNADGEIVLVPVVFLLRIYTRDELRERRRAQGKRAVEAVAEAMRQLLGAQTAAAVDAAALSVDVAAQAIHEADRVEAADLAARILGWREGDIRDDADQPVPFTPELRDALLRDGARYGAIAQGLIEASEGVRRKNSLPGPAGSQAVAQGGAANNSGATGSTS